MTVCEAHTHIAVGENKIVCECVNEISCPLNHSFHGKETLAGHLTNVNMTHPRHSPPTHLAADKQKKSTIPHCFPSPRNSPTGEILFCVYTAKYVGHNHTAYTNTHAWATHTHLQSFPLQYNKVQYSHCCGTS